MLHDIGKIGVPEAILLKPAGLTEEEYSVIKCHPENGARIIGKVPQLAPTLTGILFHHEHYDGTGYPHGLQGMEIPAAGRLIAVADAYDAMTGERPYRKSMLPEAALAELRLNSGAQFDPEMVNAFFAAFKQGRFSPGRI
jgi:HD-GYP domain-containing protein (c-di-GMP phosphodiesterase class II)